MADVMKYLIYVLPFVLAACSTANQAYYDIEGAAERYADPPKALVDYGRCPAVTVVEELGYVSEYMNASAAPRLKSRAYMEKGDSTCLYEDRSVSVDVTLDFHGQLGDKVRLRASDDPLFSYPFFVAITDRGGKIMAKQIFAATIHYPAGEDIGHYSETIRQIIPVPSKQQGKNYTVVAGFQLSDEQLAENRAMLKAAKLAQKQQKTGQAQPMKNAGQPAAAPAPIKAAVAPVIEDTSTAHPVPARKPTLNAQELNDHQPQSLVPEGRL